MLGFDNGRLWGSVSIAACPWGSTCRCQVRETLGGQGGRGPRGLKGVGDSYVDLPSKCAKMRRKRGVVEGEKGEVESACEVVADVEDF